MAKLTVGLDLGESSVGWSVVRCDDDEGLLEVLGAGSRIFPTAVDPKGNKESANRKRQRERSTRRTLQRRRRRRDKLIGVLQRAHLLPTDEPTLDLVLGRDRATADPRWINPYALRSKALHEPLEPYELGRVFVHLQERRGFLSNRKHRLSEVLADEPELASWLENDERSTAKTGKSKSEEDLGEVLSAIAELERQLQQEGHTLGEHLNQRLLEGSKVRGMRTARQMHKDEFERIWQAQASHLSAELKRAIEETFEQRPLRPFRIKLPRRRLPEGVERLASVEDRLRQCSVYPDRPAARQGHFVAQRFRILQTLANARIIVEGELPQPLTAEQIVKVAQALQRQDSMTWAALRKLIGAPKGAKLNLETEGEKDIDGNRTERLIRSIVGDLWDDSLVLDRETWIRQLDFMQDLLTQADPKKLYEILQRPHPKGNPLYGRPKIEAFRLADLSLSAKTQRLSVRAMRESLIRFFEDGEAFHGVITDMRANVQAAPIDPLDNLPEVPPMRNPRVARALHETRKVVNAIVETWGKPDAIRVELSRDIRENERARKETMRAQTKNREANAAADKWWAERGFDSTPRRRLAFRLWEAQNCTCPYTGRGLSESDLLKDLLEIDHILPLRRSADDSQSNKVLTHRETNGQKGDLTPYEWFGSDPERWNAFLARIKDTRDPARYRKAKREEMPDDFVDRQLRDTSMLSTEAASYLKALGVPVLTTNGRATGILRRLFDLNRVLPERETSKEVKGSKNRFDHRHHAIDAAIIALATPKLYRKALISARADEDGYRLDPSELIPQPVRERTARIIGEAIKGVMTSHATDHSLRGALHDQSFYGRQEADGEVRFVRRVSIQDFGDAKLSQEKVIESLTKEVYDPDLRDRLIRHLRAVGKPSDAFSEPPIIEFGNGVRRKVESVRIRHKLTDKAMIYLGEGRWAKPNSNHHGEIVRTANGKLDFRTVRMIDAARVIQKRGTVKGATVGPGESLVLVLFSGDLVETDDGVYRVAGVSECYLTLREPNDARSGPEKGRVPLRSSNAFAKVKRVVFSDPLGRLVTE